jgi:hypothetical protein
VPSTGSGFGCLSCKCSDEILRRPRHPHYLLPLLEPSSPRSSPRVRRSTIKEKKYFRPIYRGTSVRLVLDLALFSRQLHRYLRRVEEAGDGVTRQEGMDVLPLYEVATYFVQYNFLYPMLAVCTSKIVQMHPELLMYGRQRYFRPGSVPRYRITGHSPDRGPA